MTTEANASAERSAEYIIDHGIPLSECSESELAAVVNYKAAIKAREEAYSAATEAAQKAAFANAAAAKTAADAAMKTLSALAENAEKNYRESLVISKNE